MCGGVVGSDRGGFPAAIVSRGVGLVELEFALGVVASVDEGDTKGAETCGKKSEYGL